MPSGALCVTPWSGGAGGRSRSDLRHRAGLQPVGRGRGLRRGGGASRHRLRRIGAAGDRRRGRSSGAPGADAAAGRAGGRRARSARAGPAGRRRRVVGSVVGRRCAGLGRRCGAHERGWSRVGHGVVPRPLHLGRPVQPTTAAPTTSADWRYGYRSSSVRATELVVAAELEVTPGSIETEQEAVAAIVRWRREHQPGGSNAGSVFTNPEDDSAGRLIEAAGLKGFRIGTAHVSEKHANFIQADRDGRADDVYALMEHVRARGGRAMRGDVAHRGPPPGLRRREDWSGARDRAARQRVAATRPWPERDRWAPMTPEGSRSR